MESPKRESLASSGANFIWAGCHSCCHQVVYTHKMELIALALATRFTHWSSFFVIHQLGLHHQFLQTQ